MKKKKIFMLMLCGMAAISVLAAPAKKTGLSSDAEKEAQSIADGKAKAADAKHKANEAQRRAAEKTNNAKRKDLSYGSEPFSDIAEGFTKVIENSAEGETEAADPYAGKVDHVEVKKLKEDAQKEGEDNANGRGKGGKLRAELKAHGHEPDSHRRKENHQPKEGVKKPYDNLHNARFVEL